MSSVLTVSPGDPTPPYEQLRRQLVDLIGVVGDGEAVPGADLQGLAQANGITACDFFSAPRGAV